MAGQSDDALMLGQSNKPAYFPIKPSWQCNSVGLISMIGSICLVGGGI